ncbi:MAG: hypothetical protein NC900_05540 [Candidatus Omnitrophica bacterium]|nr:hypothetical protein [Candidatus Omnitrophota bacterium]
MNKKRIKALSILEYALLIVIVVGALVAMQLYLKRSIAGYWRESIDTFGFGMQYEPHLTNK